MSKKDKSIRVRVTEEEFNNIQAFADKASMTLSGYMRTFAVDVSKALATGDEAEIRKALDYITIVAIHKST